MHIRPMSPDQLAGSATRHPIAVVAERTGISQDLLRMWERRYGAVAPTRSPGGERLYSDADVERLQLIERALAGGRRIGHVARLTTSELSALVEGDRAVADRRAPASTDGDLEVLGDVVDAAMRHVRGLDGRALEELLRRGAAVHGTGAFITRVAAPLLRRIGDEWHGGRLAIAEEHLASAVVESIIVDAMRAMRAVPGAPALLVATPGGSRHVIAAAMAGAIAAAEGWNVIFLGGDLPVSELAASARVTEVQAVALSVQYTEQEKQLVGALRALRDELPPHVQLIVGGAAVVPVAAQLRQRGIFVGATLSDLRVALRDAAGG